MTLAPLSEESVKEKLIGFIRERFLAGDPDEELTEDTPLLEHGVLNSLKVVILLNFIRDEMATEIPLAQVSGANFRDVRCIAAIVTS